MTSDVRSKLQEDILVAAPWEALRHHIANIVIVEGISIVDAGEALATDDAERVKGWLDDETLSRPTTEDVASWEEEQPDFVALIVQPWVLVQR